METSGKLRDRSTQDVFARRFKYVLTTVYLSLLLAATPGAECSGKKPVYKITTRDIEKLSPAMKDELAGLQYLMNPYQIRQFLFLESDSARVAWLKIFWKDHDPTPTTEYNEMKREHIVRVRLARQFFRTNKWPGWDKRGEVFIRYGPPDYRGKVWGEVTARKMHPPGEVWFYDRLNMLVSFQNFRLTGEYIYSLDPLGSAEKLSPELVEFLLYETDQSLTSLIPQNLLEPSESRIEGEESIVDRSPDLPEDIDAIMDPDRKEMVPKDISFIFQKDRILEAANNFEKVLEEKPSTYPFNFAHKPLPFYFDVDQFKAGGSINRVEVHLELPVSAEETKKERSFDASAVVWDTQFRELAREEKTIVLRSSAISPYWAELLPTQLVFSLPKGYYRMGITVREKASGRSSSFRTTVSLDDFSEKLSVSDILFARKISRSEDPSLFTRGPLEIIPHPTRAYKRSYPIPVYFEIYNLGLDERGASRYSVEYRIVPHSPRKSHFWDRYEKTIPVVSSSFSASGYSKDESQHIFVHTENLWKGSFDFLVTVGDSIMGEVAFRKATFSILE